MESQGDIDFCEILCSTIENIAALAASLGCDLGSRPVSGGEVQNATHQ